MSEGAKYSFFLAYSAFDGRWAEKLRAALSPFACAKTWDEAWSARHVWELAASSIAILLFSRSSDQQGPWDEISWSMEMTRRNKDRVFVVYPDGPPGSSDSLPYGLRALQALDGKQLGIDGVAERLRSELSSIPTGNLEPPPFASAAAIVEMAASLEPDVLDDIINDLGAPAGEFRSGNQEQTALDLVLWAQSEGTERLASAMKKFVTAYGDASGAGARERSKDLSRSSRLGSAVRQRLAKRQVSPDELARSLDWDSAELGRHLRGDELGAITDWFRIGRMVGLHDSEVTSSYIVDQLSAQEAPERERLLSKSLPADPGERNVQLRKLVAERPSLRQMADVLLRYAFDADGAPVPGVSTKLVRYLWARTLQEHNRRDLAGVFFASASKLPGDEDLNVSITLSQANLHTESGSPMAALGYFEALHSVKDSFTPRQLAFWSLFFSEARMVSALMFRPRGVSERREELEASLSVARQACEASEEAWWTRRCDLWSTFLRTGGAAEEVRPFRKFLRHVASPRSAEADFVALAGALAVWERPDPELEEGLRDLVRHGDHGLAYHLLTCARRPAKSGHREIR